MATSRNATAKKKATPRAVAADSVESASEAQEPSYASRATADDVKTAGIINGMSFDEVESRLRAVMGG